MLGPVLAPTEPNGESRVVPATVCGLSLPRTTRQLMLSAVASDAVDPSLEPEAPMKLFDFELGSLQGSVRELAESDLPAVVAH